MKRDLKHHNLFPISPRSSSRRTTPSPPSNGTGAPDEQDLVADDPVPSLPPSWEPPSYSQQMLSPRSASPEGEVIHM